MKRVFDAVGLAVELVNDLAVTLPGAVDVADTRFDELIAQLAGTRVECISLVSKLYDLEEGRSKAVPEHEELLKKVRTKAKTLEEPSAANRNGAKSVYLGVLRSFRGIIKTVVELHAGNADTLT